MRLTIIAGEASGDALGAALVQELREKTPVTLTGVGGELLAAQGLSSLFPYQELSIVGLSAVLKQLPKLLRRVRQTADHIIATNPDMAVMIDAQDFCDRVAKRVRKIAPHITLIKYVCPTVWAWRAGRAAKLKPIYDEVLALFPFEPAVMEKLKGCKTTYVGHPLCAKLSSFQETSKTHNLVLAGSRRSEIRHILPIFMQTIQKTGGHWLCPTVPHVKQLVEEIISQYPLKPVIIEGEAAKYQAFAGADYALAASGTVTLELALCNVPHIAAYIGGEVEAFIMRKLVKIPSILLPNIILNEKIVPEFLQNFTVSNLQEAIHHLDRAGQKQGFMRMKAMMNTPHMSAAELLFTRYQNANKRS